MCRKTSRGIRKDCYVSLRTLSNIFNGNCINKDKALTMNKSAPSISSAYITNLAKEIQTGEEGGADYIHVDVMDGHFVPNITIGPLIVEAIRPVTKLPLDVHLMIEQPDNYIESFCKAGADIITVHEEVCV